jgi:predicted lysophospholipase L1 biosynthesis ABC-type transport system permease subunit
VWQRRPRLAKLKLEGFPRGELWRTILMESILLLAVGCVAGAVFGLYGQQLLDRALANVINFPVVYSIAFVSALAGLAISPPRLPRSLPSLGIWRLGLRLRLLCRIDKARKQPEMRSGACHRRGSFTP